MSLVEFKFLSEADETGVAARGADHSPVAASQNFAVSSAEPVRTWAP